MGASDARARVVRIFVISCVCMLSAGSQYSLSAWSPELKQNLGCSQSEIEQFGTIGNIGSYLGPLVGVLAYALKPQWCGLLCAFFTVLGFLPMTLAVRSTTGAFAWLRNPAALGGFFALGSFGSSLLYYLLISTNLNNMPKHRRGSCVAVLATLLGFSAVVYTLIYNNLLDHRVDYMLLLICCVSGSLSLVAALVVRPIDPALGWPTGLDESLLGGAQHSDLEDESEFAAGSLNGSPYKLSNGAGVLSSPSPGAPASESFYGQSHERGQLLITTLDELDGQRQSDGGMLLTDAGKMSLQEHEQESMQSRTCGGGLAGRVFGAFLFLVRSLTYWLLIVIFFLVAGSGLMVINNVGHVVQSLSGGVQDRNLTTLLIMLLSLCNGGGRLLMGISDLLRVRKAAWLILACVLMSLTHFAFAYLFTHKNAIVYGVIGTGLAYGFLWAIVPIIISDNFGPKSFSMNFGWVSCVSSPASFFFNHFAGSFYDDHTPKGSNQCVGAECYRSTFILCGSASALAAVIALAMIPRTQKGGSKASVQPAR